MVRNDDDNKKPSPLQVGRVVLPEVAAPIGGRVMYRDGDLRRPEAVSPTAAPAPWWLTHALASNVVHQTGIAHDVVERIFNELAVSGYVVVRPVELHYRREGGLGLQGSVHRGADLVALIDTDGNITAPQG